MSISEASEAGQAQAGAPDRIPFVAATETIEVGPPLRVKPTYAWLEWDSGQHLCNSVLENLKQAPSPGVAIWFVVFGHRLPGVMGPDASYCSTG